MASGRPEVEVRGMVEAMKQASAGLALLTKGEEEAQLDVPAAEAFKQEQELAIKCKEDEANTLTGKDNKKARAEVGKLVASMKVDPKYVDACKVVKGLQPPNGNFKMTTNKDPEPPAQVRKTEPVVTASEVDMKAAEDSKEKKAKDVKPKKIESAGLSKAEKDELEKLKGDIIARKAELKAAGKSGGDCNKDEQVVAWVNRMTELKVKEDPSLAEVGKDKGKDKGKKAKGSLSSQEQAELPKLKAELEAYRQKLIHEFGYSKKDIAADPEFAELEQKVKQLEGRA